MDSLDWLELLDLLAVLARMVRQDSRVLLALMVPRVRRALQARPAFRDHSEPQDHLVLPAL